MTIVNQVVKHEMKITVCKWIFQQHLDAGLRQFNYQYSDNNDGNVTLTINERVEDFNNTFTWLVGEMRKKLHLN